MYTIRRCSYDRRGCCVSCWAFYTTNILFQCLLSLPRAWSLQMSALLQRSRLEGHHSRTVERAVMQTEVISCCLSFFSNYIQSLYPAVQESLISYECCHCSTKALFICYFLYVHSNQILLFIELLSDILPVWLELLPQRMTFENQLIA
jgi:hypothetical protein